MNYCKLIEYTLHFKNNNIKLIKLINNAKLFLKNDRLVSGSHQHSKFSKFLLI